MYDDLLLPTDGSEQAQKAAKHAIDHARNYDARLHAIYVIDTGTSLLAVSKADVRETLRDVGEQESAQAFGQVEPLADEAGVELVTDVVEGPPEERIVDYAEEQPIDLIVMGTHGRGGLGRRLLGSVTEQVVRSAPVSVLTVGDGSSE